VAPEVSITKTGPAEVLACDPITYKLVVRNSGDGAATGVKVVDTLPNGMTTQDGRSSVSFDVGTLAAGQSRELSVTAKANGPGEYTNCATVTGDGGISDEACATTKVRKPALAVTKTGPDKRFIGRPSTFEITVRNTGDGEARNTILRDTIPAGADFVEASQGGVRAGNTVTWNLGNMAPNASRTVSITLNARTAMTVRNEATATADCADAASDAAAVPYEGIPALLLEVVDGPDPVELNTNTVYTITVTNQGSKAGKDIVVTTTLPAEMSYVSSGGPTSGRVSGKTITFGALPSLAPGASATWLVTARADSAASVRTKFTLDSEYLGGNLVTETESTNLY
jgi:uncharacterized repeat protein (TIGR01451 family)